jgi:hypothetical protein
MITHSKDDKAAAYLEKIMKILRKEKYLKIEKRAKNIWVYVQNSEPWRPSFCYNNDFRWDTRGVSFS